MPYTPCKDAKKVWQGTKFGLMLNLKTNILFIELLLSIRRNFCTEDMAFFCYIAWAIWENRNNFIHGKKSRNPVVTMEWCQTLQEEFSCFNKHKHEKKEMV